MKIVLTGSLGHIGQPLAEELVQKGHTVIVVSSKPEKQTNIEVLGAIAAIGSLEDVDFLVSTVTGADAVYCMIPPNFTEPQMAYYRRIGNNYKQAIQRSGVKRVVLLSSYGAHLDKGTGIILCAHIAEEILNELPAVAITHLRPGYFYYNLHDLGDMIKEAGFIGANYGGTDKIVLVHPSDIAQAAAEELARPATGISVRYVASDERTADEIARVLGTAIGIPGLQWITFTDEQMRESLEKSGMPAYIVDDFIDLGASTHSGILREDYEQHKPVMGKVKLEDFAKEFAAAFRPK